MKKYYVLIFVFLFGVLLMGCSTEVEDVTADKKEESTEDSKKEEQKEDKVFEVGDTVKVNGLEITVTKASFTDPAQYSKAENGKVLTLEIATENSGDDSAFIDNTEFNLYDTDGNKFDEYYGYDEHPYLTSISHS